jgi:hypothetical protein
VRCRLSAGEGRRPRPALATTDCRRPGRFDDLRWWIAQPANQDLALSRPGSAWLGLNARERERREHPQDHRVFGGRMPYSWGAGSDEEASRSRPSVRALLVGRAGSPLPAWRCRPGASGASLTQPARRAAGWPPRAMTGPAGGVLVMTAARGRRTVSRSQIRQRWTVGVRLARSSRSSRCLAACRCRSATCWATISSRAMVCMVPASLVFDPAVGSFSGGAVHPRHSVGDAGRRHIRATYGYRYARRLGGAGVQCSSRPGKMPS